MRPAPVFRAIMSSPTLLLRRVGERRLARICADTRTLVLSYDDGPSPDLTPELLDLLASHRATATFFPQGARAETNPELLDRVLAEGHEIGCHTYDHVHAWKSGSKIAVRDMERGYEVLATWVPPSGPFRPPYGKMTVAMLQAVRARNARLAWWTTVSGDTHPFPLPPPARALDRLRRTGGGVVLMHDHHLRSSRDGERRAAHVLEMTTTLIEAAPGEGWRIRSLAELDRSMAI
jgi:peptidoglycan/xylan/chitin deacetylase (PgdA/CDA1 family)